jgi:uncharacterized protein
MTLEEKNLITGLFDRLATVANQAKDPEAEQLIRSKIAENPTAPYFLAQSALVLQQAVANAQTRIAALEKQVEEASAAAAPKPSFLSGLGSFLDGKKDESLRPTYSTPPPLPPQAAPAYASAPPAGGGGFLQNAMSTAAGVAGGALLFQGIESLMGHNPGPFAGAGLPSGGFLGQQQPTEVINNYYEGSGATESASSLAGNDSLNSNADDFIPQSNDKDFDLPNFDDPNQSSISDDDFSDGGDDDAFDN